MSAAYQLAKGGVDVDVFEASPHVGGLARTIELWGQRVDLGPHRFFSSDARVNRLWLEVVGRDYEMIDRLTRIYYEGRFFYYPLRPLNALLTLGFLEAAGCMLSYLRQRLFPPKLDESTFEGWVVRRFGRRLFEIFFKTYSEKLWGIRCDDLDAAFAAQRIKKLSLFEAVKNALLGGRGNKHKTLVDTFAYPTGGTGMVYERMAERVRASGGRVHLQRPVERVLTEGGAVTGIELPGGEVLSFDHVISSMPITLLVARLPEAPAEVREAAAALRFRNTILVYLRVEGSGLFPDNWLYVHSPALRTGRITNFGNWVPQINGAERGRSTILALEYWCDDDEPLWAEDDATLIARARDELLRAGLAGEAPVGEGKVVRIRRCYPVYRRGYRAHLEPVERYLRSIEGLSVIGRYGAFKYNNQDHSILMGILAADNVLEGAKHDLWGVNTDYEYQESAVITRTGLAHV
jgi:protoporphyrinogen oxidase